MLNINMLNINMLNDTQSIKSICLLQQTNKYKIVVYFFSSLSLLVHVIIIYPNKTTFKNNHF